MQTYQDGTYEIIGAAMKVHRVLGPGLLEKVYAEAMAIELRKREMAFAREVPLRVSYEGHVLPCAYRVDLMVGRVVVELKALSRIGPTELAQTRTYVRAADAEAGLLLNFGTPSLEYRRV